MTTLYFLVSFMAMCSSVKTNSVCQVCRCRPTLFDSSKVEIMCENLGKMNSLPKNIPINVSDMRLLNINLGPVLHKGFFKTNGANLAGLSDLHLDGVNVQRFEIGCFDGLNGLKALTLNGNLNFTYDTFPKGLFRSIPYVETVNINSLLTPGEPGTYIDETLADLRFLRNLHFSAWPNHIFGPSFRTLTNLTSITFASHNSPCDLGKISPRLVYNVPLLAEFSILNCEFSSLDPTTFSSLHHLNTLVFSCLKNLAEVADVLCTLGKGSLKSLILSGLEIIGTIDTWMHFAACLYKTNVKNFGISAMSPGIFPVKALEFFRNLDYISFSNFHANLVQNGRPLKKVIAHLRLLQRMPFFKVKEFEMLYGGRDASSDKLFSKTCDYFPTNILERIIRQSQAKVDIPPKCIVGYTTPLNQTAKISTFSRSHVHVVEHVPMNPNRDMGGISNAPTITLKIPQHLEILRIIGVVDHSRYSKEKDYLQDVEKDVMLINVSPNTLRRIEVKEGNAEYIDPKYFVIGLDHVKYADFSNLKMKYIRKDFFNMFPNVITLILKYNQLGYLIARNKLLFDLQHLETLDLSYNNIESLPQNIFSNLTSLQNLTLAGNRIVNFTASLNSQPCLEWLDLSWNAIQYFTKDQMDSIENNRRTILTVNMAGNVFSCGCSAVPFLDWVQRDHTMVTLSNKQVFSCIIGKNETIHLEHISKLDVTSIREECQLKIVHKQLISAIVSAGCVAFIVITLTASYFNRWKIRYHYYLLRRRRFVQGQIRRENRPDEDDELFDGRFDAYVSFNFGHEDNTLAWVFNIMRVKLEHENNFRLYLRERNNIPGECEADNIASGIERSRKVILILSESFFEDHCRDLEFKLALHVKGLDSIIPIMIEDVPIYKMTKLVINILRRKEPIKWSDNEDGQQLFWKRLCDALEDTHPFQQNAEVDVPLLEQPRA